MWKAEFSNSEILNEFNTNGEEQSFGMVLRRLADLKYLSVVIGGHTEYKVSMYDGEFTIYKMGTKLIGMYAHNTQLYNHSNLENIRPIYFRTESVSFGLGNGNQVSQPSVLSYSLGFQALCDGKNITRFLKIYPHNTFEIRDS